jgi:transcriptional regulator with XRE-family HTH domain
MSYDPKRLAEAVRTHRKAAGLTQAELAEKAGLAFETISRVESGREPPSLRTATGLADALRVSLDAVVGRDLRAAPQPARTSPAERRLLEAVRNLDPATVRHLVAIAASLAKVDRKRNAVGRALRATRRA